jgi:SEC-C motif domain protein
MQSIKCYCGSGEFFKQCCQPIINGLKAHSAEQLMRSRYSAYAINDAQYLYHSYATTSQIEQSINDIASWAKQCHWISLTIHHCEDNPEFSTVEFSATYIQKSKLYVLHELSKFIIENEHWRYLDGKIIKHQELHKLKRNDSCPCHSGKKFKQCCG